MHAAIWSRNPVIPALQSTAVVAPFFALSLFVSVESVRYLKFTSESPIHMQTVSLSTLTALVCCIHFDVGTLSLQSNTQNEGQVVTYVSSICIVDRDSSEPRTLTHSLRSP